MSDTWFNVKELATGLYGIGEFEHVEEVISFLLVGEHQSLLIDTGMGFFSIKSVVDRITKLPCRVVNTHSHFDHVGSNFEFSNVAMFDDSQNRRAAADGYNEAYLAKWACTDQFCGFVPTTASAYSIPAFSHAQFFKDGATFNVKPFNFEAIHTPGHCDDSVCLYDLQSGWLFSGDLLYDGPIFIEKRGGLAKFRQSVERVSALPNLKRIFASHNYFEFSLNKLQMLREVLARMTSAELEGEVTINGMLRLVPY